jgi:hypothetical protein
MEPRHYWQNEKSQNRRAILSISWPEDVSLPRSMRSVCRGRKPAWGWWLIGRQQNVGVFGQIEGVWDD